MAVTRNLRDGTITLRDGSGTPKTLVIPISSGDFSFDINTPSFIVMNRGKIDSRKAGDQQPVDISFSVMFEQWSYGSGLSTGISVADAFLGIGGASTWVSTDACGPFSVDIQFDMVDPCTPGKKETLVFGKFHADKLSFKEGNEANSLSITGKALAQLPTRTYA
jgi:hypothetical protein